LKEYLAQQQIHNYQLTVIGKKPIEELINSYPEKLICSFPTLTVRNFLTIAQELTDLVMSTTPPYSSVIVFSNVFKNFFVQKTTKTTLIPFNPASIINNSSHMTEGYLWDEAPHEILDKLALHYIEAQFQHLIFQSLLSEHAARFISMDNSTRNANVLLAATKLEYNKIRQSKITTEISELSGTF
jgi:F-type H+-transporting ATPase subunit gamma